MKTNRRYKRIRRTCIALKIRRAREIMSYVYCLMIAGILIFAATACNNSSGKTPDYTGMREYAYFESMVLNSLPGADEDPLVICQAHDDKEIDTDLAYGLLIRGEEVPANEPARYLFHDFNKLAKIKGLKCACMGFFSEFPDAEWYTSKFTKAEWTACGWDA